MYIRGCCPHAERLQGHLGQRGSSPSPGSNHQRLLKPSSGIVLGWLGGRWQRWELTHPSCALLGFHVDPTVTKVLLGLCRETEEDQRMPGETGVEHIHPSP